MTPEELANKIRKALAEGENWQVRGLAAEAAKVLIQLSKEHDALGALADRTANQLADLRREVASGQKP